eukprot:GHVO01027124.1.p1 GENE.GHVO01027124.1~~GHVO01027124.1.p1  ORF type:complete len:504 (-),score=81.93 GHVO01027124.1:1260-2771(-)
MIKEFDEIALEFREVSQSTSHVTQLRKQISDLESELQTAKNQDVTVRHLEDKISAINEEWRESVQSELKKNTEEIQRQFQHEISEWNRSSEDLKKQIKSADARAEMADEKRLVMHQQYELQIAAIRAECDALNHELERRRSPDVSSDAPATAASIATSQKLEAAETSLRSAQIRCEYLQSDVEDLKETVALLTKRYEDSKLEKESSEQSAQTELGRLRSKLEEVEADLASRPSTEEHNKLLNKLEMIDSVEYCDLTAASTELEAMLMAKVQQVEATNANMRVRCHDFENRINELQGTKTSLEDQLVDSRNVLTQMESESRNQPWKSSDLSNMGKTGEGDVPSMIDIALTQRDRFRQRVLELEQTRDEWKATAEGAKSKVSKLTADCVALVERIRFLEAVVPSGGEPQTKRDFDSLAFRHGVAYEDRLSKEVCSIKVDDMVPFTRFQAKERQRKLHTLSSLERVSISIGQSILQYRSARAMFLTYIVTLHLIVAACLLKMMRLG